MNLMQSCGDPDLFVQATYMSVHVDRQIDTIWSVDAGHLLRHLLRTCTPAPDLTIFERKGKVWKMKKKNFSTYQRLCLDLCCTVEYTWTDDGKIVASFASFLSSSAFLHVVFSSGFSSYIFVHRCVGTSSGTYRVKRCVAIFGVQVDRPGGVHATWRTSVQRQRACWHLYMIFKRARTLSIVGRSWLNRWSMSDDLEHSLYLFALWLDDIGMYIVDRIFCVRVDLLHAAAAAIFLLGDRYIFLSWSIFYRQYIPEYNG